MKVQTIISPEYKDIEVHVCHDCIDENTENVVRNIKTMYSDTLVGTDTKSNKCVINVADVVRFFAQEQKVFAVVGEEEYSITKKLYELETTYEKEFVRASKSELVNLKKIKKLDMSISGTIRIIFKDGSATFTSRRNVAQIKKMVLGETK